MYTAQDIIDVATSDDVRVGQDGSDGFVIHQFKDYVSLTGAVFTCELRTNYDPALSPVRLQIYNQVTPGWETIDTDNTSAPDTDFTLQAGVADLTEYKDARSVVSCRVYQSVD